MAKPDVKVPAPETPALAADKAPPFEKELPSYSSVLEKAFGGALCPPATNPAVKTPPCAATYLAVLKAPPVVQLDPSYSSVAGLAATVGL